MHWTTVLIVFAALTRAGVRSQNVDAFDGWKAAHGRAYASAEEEAYRRSVWTANAAFVAKHNAGNPPYRLAMNAFGDLTHSEFKERYLWPVPLSVDAPVNATDDAETSRRVGLAIASEGPVDWRDKKVVAEVKNQGQCGSCWAFSAIASIESNNAIAGKKLVSLSEQQLVDCSGKYGNEGCRGGLMDNGFRYVRDAGGVEAESDYPYKARDGKCAFDKKKVAATIKGFKDLPSGDESALVHAVHAAVVAVAIDASSPQFQFYSHGVYEDDECSSQQLNHGVAVVGVTSSNGTDAYIVKNSWGAAWGDKGYIQFAANRKNMCGVASVASYALV